MQAGAGQGDLPAWQLMECQRASSCTGMWVQVAMLFMTRGAAAPRGQLGSLV